MKKIRIVIVEDNQDLCAILSSFIEDNFSDIFEVVGVAHDGRTGIKVICDTQPNIALIDIVLPILDGISVLEKLNSLHMTDSVCCVMLTAVSNDDITKKAVQLGSKYYFLKPFDKHILVQRLIEIHQANEQKLQGYAKNEFNTESIIFDKRADENSPELYATNILQKIGIPANLTGYYYLRTALVKCIEDNSLLTGLTKVLYPSIGKEFKTTGQRVERSIRHSIEKAWCADSSDIYYSMFGRQKPKEYSKPSNGVFIMDLVDYYKIRYNPEKRQH